MLLYPLSNAKLEEIKLEPSVAARWLAKSKILLL